MSKIQVSVTADDIETAERMIVGGEDCRANCCPVSLALRRHYQDAYVPSNLWTQLKHQLRVPLPLIAQHFIRAFDDGKQVSPIEFELEVGA